MLIELIFLACALLKTIHIKVKLKTLQTKKKLNLGYISMLQFDSKFPDLYEDCFCIQFYDGTTIVPVG
jgi:hypothetical protein